MSTKATVKIYGQPYTIIGDKSEKEIESIAKYLDEQMKAIGKQVNDTSTGNVAVLSALNLIEELMEARNNKAISQEELEKYKEENKHYQDLWEKSKASSVECKKALVELKEKVEKYEAEIKSYADKCDEYETNFFDLQMENIQLKSQIEKMRPQSE